jgi:NAD(P)H dehydrogenase (quinone)
MARSMSWTAREDAVEAAALILASDGSNALTSSPAPTFRDIATIASEVSARTIALEVMDQDEWVAAQVTAGQPEFMTRYLLGIYQAAHEGFFAGVDPLLSSLLGHEPRTVRDLLAPPTIS